MYKTPFTTLLIIVTLLSACDQAQQTADENDVNSTSPSSGSFFLTNDQLNNAGIAYGKIELHQLSSDVNARGQLILPVNSTADLVSHYPGIINQVFVRNGEKVSRGKLLASLASPEFINAQQRYLMVKNQIGMLELEYERQKELNEEKITSDKFYQKAESNYMVALAELKGLGIQLEMTGINLTDLAHGDIAPELLLISSINGYVENIEGNPGKYIMQDERVMSVINRENLLIELNVFEKDIMKIIPGQRVTFSLSNLSNEVFEAYIIAVGNLVGKENRVVKVTAEFSNSNERMLPGMFVAAEIHTGENNVEALPEEAVTRLEGNEHIIFYTTPSMQSDEGTAFRLAYVDTGFVEDGYIQVILKESIPENAMVVVKGAYFLKTEMAKQAE